MSQSRTGDADVDRALEPLAGLAQRPLVEHVAVVDEVHRDLERHLSGQDED